MKRKLEQNVSTTLLPTPQKKHLSIELSFGDHPYGIRPWGNFYADRANGVVDHLCRNPGLGILHQLEDDYVLSILYHLSFVDLCILSVVSKALYAFSNFENLWRTILLSDAGGNFTFRHTWKHSYKCYKLKNINLKKTLPLKINGFYSDVLFHPWFCATTIMDKSWLEINNIDRRNNLSHEEFIQKYEKPGIPVIITDVVSKWPAYKKWSKEYLLQKYGDVVFAAGAVNMKLNDYFAYTDNVRESERPLYIFDKKFVEKCTDLEEDYDVPVYFKNNLFSLLGDDCPDYRWLIIGPDRSGSAFHIDPNQTSAWNAIISGRKKWILYPPGTPPPGVFPSEDMSHVKSPVSLFEWFSDFYHLTKDDNFPKPVECICEAGEMMFIPHGWWHCVMNLGRTDTIAITQNYVSFQNLPSVLNFLANKPDQVSGCQNGSSLYQKFHAKMMKKYPLKMKNIEKEKKEKKKDGKR